MEVLLGSCDGIPMTLKERQKMLFCTQLARPVLLRYVEIKTIIELRSGDAIIAEAPHLNAWYNCVYRLVYV